MSSETSNPAPAEAGRLLYCHCAYSRVVPKDVKAEVLKGLAASGRAFDAVPDLCESAARCDPGLKKLAQASEGGVDIVACYPRAVRWLFHAAEAPLPEDGIRIHNMRTDSAEEVLGAVGLAAAVDADPEDDPPEPVKSTETATAEEEASP